jgi:DNA repair protein RAD16
MSVRVCVGLAALQNRVGELYSLIRFLRIYPYAFYFCAQGCAKTATGPPCACRSLDYSFSRNHRKCDHCSCARPPCLHSHPPK